MSENHRSVPPGVLRAGHAVAASPRLLTALRSAHGTGLVPDPVRGQLWRARWGGTAQLVLVLQVTAAGTAVVAPVTVDPPAADEHSVMLDSAQTVLGTPATVWGGIAAEIPFFVFDLLIDTVTPAVAVAAEQVAAGQKAALPDGVSAGTSAEPPFDPADGARADLADALAELRRASWAPSPTPDGKPLSEQLRGRTGMPALMSELAQALGLNPPDVIALLQGTRAVPPDHVPVIARITGLDERDVQQAVAPLPDDLVQELSRPQWRKAITSRLPRGRSETAERLTVAYGALALAARQTGPASAGYWPQRISHYLETHPADERET